MAAPRVGELRHCAVGDRGSGVFAEYSAKWLYWANSRGERYHAALTQ
ncbi:MAG: hypothetical protein QM784_38980 [Polyangiaceae bacterium]